MSPRPHMGEQRMPQILDAALRVYARKGISRATVAEIAEEAGLSKALVFMYFRSKDELLVAAARYAFGIMHLRLHDMAEQDGSFDALILQWADELAAALSEPGPMAVGLEMLAAATRDEAIRSVVAEAYATYRETFVALVSRSVARGEVREIDVEAAATSLIAMIEGMNLLWLAVGKMDLANSYREGLTMLLSGIAIRRES